MCTGYCTKMLPRLQVKILTGRQTSKKKKTFTTNEILI